MRLRPANWVRFEHAGREGIGRLEGDRSACTTAISSMRRRTSGD